MAAPEEPPLPTLANAAVKTEDEALRILQAVLDDILAECPRRMGAHGPRVICPGDVFVFKKNGAADITRWTDGMKGHDTSGSRRRGPVGAHATCYVIRDPPARHGVPTHVRWVRRVWKHTHQLGGNDTVWSIVAYDFEDEGGPRLRTVEDALSSLLSLSPPGPPPLPPPPPPPPPPQAPAAAPYLPSMLTMAGIENSHEDPASAHPQNAWEHNDHPSSPLTPSPVIEFRPPLFTQTAASASAATAAASAPSPRRETLPSLRSLQLPRPRVMPFERAPRAERRPEDARLLALLW